MMATEAASMAAQGAATALERRSGGDDKFWFKVQSHPASTPKGVEQYLASLDREFPGDFTELRQRPNREVDQSIQTDEVKQRGSFFCLAGFHL